MKEVELVLQANLCSLCNEIWFTPHFETEGEQSTCPYCKYTLQSKKVILDQQQSPETIENIPTEIMSLMDKKTKDPLIEKVCVFCNNFVLISKADDERAKHCPYCGDTLTLCTDQHTHSNIDNDTPYNGQLDETLNRLCMKPVIVKFVDNRPWIIKTLFKKINNIRGVFVWVCTESKMVQMVVEPELEIKWFHLKDIESVQQIFVPDSE